MTLEREIQIYEQLTDASKARWEEARRYMPGGDTRTSTLAPK